MFTAALFIIAKEWKLATDPSTNECINMWYVTEYYSAIKRGKGLIYTTI